MPAIRTASQAGTIESSDIMITLAPLAGGTGRVLELTSPVKKQYGRQIEEAILDMLNQYEINDVQIVANDRGALDCTIRARMETAITRALNLEEKDEKTA